MTLFNVEVKKTITVVICADNYEEAEQYVDENADSILETEEKDTRYTIIGEVESEDDLICGWEPSCTPYNCDVTIGELLK